MGLVASRGRRFEANPRRTVLCALASVFPTESTVPGSTTRMQLPPSLLLASWSLFHSFSYHEYLLSPPGPSIYLCVTNTTSFVSLKESPWESEYMCIIYFVQKPKFFSDTEFKSLISCDLEMIFNGNISHNMFLLKPALTENIIVSRVLIRISFKFS